MNAIRRITAFPLYVIGFAFSLAAVVFLSVAEVVDVEDPKGTWA